MKNFAKFAAVAALALSATAFAGSAGAATQVSIGTSGNPESHPQVTWTGTGSGFGTLASVAGDTATVYFTDPAFAAFSALSGTTFTLLGTADLGSGGSLVNNGTTLTEKGINGNFEFKNGSTVLIGGNFTNAWLQGSIGGNSANFNNANGGSVVFYSDIAGLLDGLSDDSMGFTLTGLTGLSTGIQSTGGHLKSFGSNTVAGSFDATGSVPEPATWGLMIMGFGGVGALLRSRRRQAAFA